MLIVTVTLRNASGQTISGVTYGGVALTLITGAEAVNGIQVRTGMYCLANPPSGTANVIVSLSAATTCFAGASSWVNVHQTASFGSAVTATGNLATASVNVTGGSGKVIIDSLGKRDSTENPVAAKTLLHQGVSTNATAGINVHNGSQYDATGAASVTMSWNWGTTSRQFAYVAVPMNPA
jgi:hypothetical protein